MSEISNKEQHTLWKQKPDQEIHTMVTPELKAQEIKYPEIEYPEIKSPLMPKIINELKSKPMTIHPTSPDFPYSRKTTCTIPQPKPQNSRNNQAS